MSELESNSNQNQPNKKSPGKNRYISDLENAAKAHKVKANSSFPLPVFGAALAFLILVAIVVNQTISVAETQLTILLIASVVGGYMALNIGANDVANNMGPAVGGGVLSIGAALTIAVVCESAGALLAGGDVVKTVAKGIISPDESLSVESFRLLMVCALLAAALWINLATALNAPVSTTHSIVGGVMGGGARGHARGPPPLPHAGAEDDRLSRGSSRGSPQPHEAWIDAGSGSSTGSHSPLRFSPTPGSPRAGEVLRLEDITVLRRR